MHGVTFDGQHVWFASGDKLNAFDPASGKTVRSIDVAAHAGTAFDGQHLFQLAEDRIQKIDPKTGRVLATIPAPGGGGDSGLAWAEGTLWVGQYRDRKIHQVDPETGAILRTIESNRFVTGVTWVEGELWHGTWEGDESDLRRVDPRTGEVLERLEMPPGVGVSGLESDGGDQFFCGGGKSGEGEGRPPAQARRRVTAYARSISNTAPSRTSAPRAQSSQRVSSSGEWLMPRTLGTKIMPIGESCAIICASCPAPLGIRWLARPSRPRSVRSPAALPRPRSRARCDCST